MGKIDQQDLLQRLADSFHPLTALVVLGLDWALFGGVTVASAGLGLFLSVILGFLGGLLGGTLAQRLFAEESWTDSLKKGFFAGLAVGAPFPIAGTALGGFLLAAFGLDALRDRFFSSGASGAFGDSNPKA